MQVLNIFVFVAVLAFRHGTSATNEPGLCLEFQTLRNTIPINELIAITERHYRYDASFRRAMYFVHTGRFAMLAGRIERSKQYRSMLAVFERAGVNVTDIATIDRIINCLMLPLLGVDAGFGGGGDYGYGGRYGAGYGYGGAALPDKKYEIINNVNINVHNGKDIVKNDHPVDDYDYYNDYGFDSEPAFERKSRTLQSYALDVFRIMPKETFATAVCQETGNNAQFAEFWKIAQSRSFQSQIMRALNSRTFAGILRTFRSHGIDVPKLLAIIFKIFALAPLA